MQGSIASPSVSNGAHAVLLLLLLGVVVFPFLPSMRGEGLDQSWRSGMNSAIENGIEIGKELVFSYGPCTSVLTRIYHPTTDPVSIGGSLLSLGLGLQIDGQLFTCSEPNFPLLNIKATQP